MKKLGLQHWVAMTMSLVLAITLWALIRKNLAMNASPSAKAESGREGKFSFGTSGIPRAATPTPAPTPPRR